MTAIMPTYFFARLEYDKNALVAIISGALASRLTLRQILGDEL
jgi:hypothetical protein